MKYKYLAFATILIAAYPQARAGDWLSESIRFSGFGTLGAAVTDSDDGHFRKEQQKTGATRSPSLLADSNLGLQLDAAPTPWLATTLQTLTVQRTRAHLSTRVEWAFARVLPTDDVTLRVGKLNIPNFMISDSRRIGYANTAIRPSDEVYGLDLLNGGLMGSEGNWRLKVGGNSITFSAQAGRTNYRDIDTPTTPVGHVLGFNALWDGGWYQLRVGQVTGSPKLDALAEFLEPLLAPGQSLKDDQYIFKGIGGNADFNNFVGQAEYVQRRSSLFPNQVNAKAWYILAGYRTGVFLPYIQFAKRIPQSTLTTLTFPQTSQSIGLRWEAFRKASIKFQIDRIDTHKTAGASFSTPYVNSEVGQISAPVNKPVTALSTAIDFIF